MKKVFIIWLFLMHASFAMTVHNHTDTLLHYAKNPPHAVLEDPANQGTIPPHRSVQLKIQYDHTTLMLQSSTDQPPAIIMLQKNDKRLDFYSPSRLLLNNENLSDDTSA